jgi:hypothetical protein
MRDDDTAVGIAATNDHTEGFQRLAEISKPLAVDLFTGRNLLVLGIVCTCSIALLYSLTGHYR